MSMIEPFMPHPERQETIAAADAGVGAPAPAPGFGIAGEEPDGAPAEEDPTESAAGPAREVPFRTPDPDDVRRPD